MESGRDRTVLDAMLREVADAGVFVSTHPEVILKLGTKEVLHRTRSIGWGCETCLYETVDQLRHGLPLRLSSGKARVLKQYRGNGGQGVWKVQLPAPEGPAKESQVIPGPETVIHVRHARRGCYEESMTLGQFLGDCEQYFSGDGRMIDQQYQERLPEGMIRCYLAGDRVVGFGHQAINGSAPTGSPSVSSRDHARVPVAQDPAGDRLGASGSATAGYLDRRLAGPVGL
ncbi:MAG: Cj0069 family protein [bacterium]|nr:Cj0069 family protein [bacterium]